MARVTKWYRLRSLWLFLLFTALSLSACGPRSTLEGTYAYSATSLGVTLSFVYTFKSNGRVTVSSMGQESEMNYTIDGKTVRITNPQLPAAGTQVLTLLEDGSLQGGTGLLLTRQKK